MYTTDAIILKKIDVGEADTAFVFYTKEFGKMRALAQGVKKEEAKLKGHLEPLSLCTIGFVLAKNGERLTHAELQNYWGGIRLSTEKNKAALYLAALINTHCFWAEKDEKLWNLLVEEFSLLDQATEAALSSFLRAFEKKLLAVLGYQGETDIRTLGPMAEQAP